MNGQTGNNERPQEGESGAAILADILLLVPVLLATSGAFYLLYGWHVLPLTGYALGFWQVFGLRLTLTATINMVRPPIKGAAGKPARSIGVIAGCGLVVLLGWWAKLMM